VWRRLPCVDLCVCKVNSISVNQYNTVNILFTYSTQFTYGADAVDVLVIRCLRPHSHRCAGLEASPCESVTLSAAQHAREASTTP
jgi:hypothetical protein